MEIINTGKLIIFRFKSLLTNIDIFIPFFLCFYGNRDVRIQSILFLSQLLLKLLEYKTGKEEKTVTNKWAKQR